MIGKRLAQATVTGRYELEGRMRQYESKLYEHLASEAMAAANKGKSEITVLCAQSTWDFGETAAEAWTHVQERFAKEDVVMSFVPCGGTGTVAKLGPKCNIFVSSFNPFGGGALPSIGGPPYSIKLDWSAAVTAHKADR